VPGYTTAIANQHMPCFHFLACQLVVLGVDKLHIKVQGNSQRQIDCSPSVVLGLQKPANPPCPAEAGF
jgi:hypothetical protein